MDNNVSFKESVVMLLLILITIGSGIIYFHLSAHIAILAAIFLLISFMVYKGMSWDDMHEGIISGITPGLIPIVLFILIGAIISVWIASGTIPTIMVYGFSFLSPNFFLVAVFIICGIVGAAVGSSFTTVTTVGIAFVGMGKMMGFDLAVTAGAIVSGALLGNVISPLSDTANLAAATAEVDLFEHIKGVLKTVVPAFIVSLIFFFILGRNHTNAVDTNEIDQMVAVLKGNFTVTPVVLLPVVVLLICAWKKIPAIPTLLLNILLSIVLIKIYQGSAVTIQDFGSWLQDGFVAETGDKMIDPLLSRGGIQSMMGSVSLIILALTLGGLLIKMSVIDTILDRINDVLSKPNKLIILTALTAIGVNLLIGEQYLSIILPGKAYRHRYEALGLEPTLLSRTLSDAGTVVNPLIPWGVSGVFIAGALDVPTLSYVPYAIFCYVLPLLTLVLGALYKKEKVA
ncbi:Na+/H+ antiporter NhaC [Vagococcus fessus]|uniref:Na+/H+ antiporter NhaC n=1 Tax=Vagococcus fessus TaxID=120370 RepID=A0A430ABQ4_9ENTE|nr:Na+/H+ antiporter NhaC [Vagococcus fessus]RSU04578.1 Na+/H+ antiporter NhaC [Vagococcus fessus]